MLHERQDVFGIELDEHRCNISHSRAEVSRERRRSHLVTEQYDETEVGAPGEKYELFGESFWVDRVGRRAIEFDDEVRMNSRRVERRRRVRRGELVGVGDRRDRGRFQCERDVVVREPLRVLGAADAEVIRTIELVQDQHPRTVGDCREVGQVNRVILDACVRKQTANRR